MKLTDQHLTDDQINTLLEYTEKMRLPEHRSFLDDQIISALLELKQRRAEDRQGENDAK